MHQRICDAQIPEEMESEENHWQAMPEKLETYPEDY